MEHVPAGQDATGVMPGDILLCHRRGFVPWVIRLGERLRLRHADVSHAAFCDTPSSTIEALTRGVARAPLTAYRGIEYWIVRTGLTGDDAAQAVAFARSCVGDEYGWLTDLGIALRFLTPGRGLWFGVEGTQICSSLCAEALVRGWVIYPVDAASISPQELFSFYASTSSPASVSLQASLQSSRREPTIMQTEEGVLTQLLTALASILGPLSPFAKAIVPATLAVVVAAVNSVFAGKIDTLSLTIAGSGLVLALVTYLIPNVAKPIVPTPAPAAGSRTRL